MDDLNNKVNELISRYEKMSSDEFVDYFADKIGAESVAHSAPRAFKLEPFDSAQRQTIETFYIKFPFLEYLPNEDRSYFFAHQPANDKPANDEDYEGYSLCA